MAKPRLVLTRFNKVDAVWIVWSLLITFGFRFMIQVLGVRRIEAALTKDQLGYFSGG